MMGETAQEKAKRLGRVYIPAVSPAPAEYLPGEPIDSVAIKLEHGLFINPAVTDVPPPGKTESAQRAIDAGLVVVPVAETDLLKLARLVAAGILRTRQTEGGMVVQRVPETLPDRMTRLARKRRRHMKRRRRK